MSTRDRDGEFGKGHSGSAWEQDTTHATDYPLGLPRPFYLPPKAMEARLRGSVDNVELHLARSRAGRIVQETLDGQTPAEPTQMQAFAKSLVAEIPADKRALLAQLTAIRQKSAMMRRPADQALLAENESWFGQYHQGLDQLVALEKVALQNQIAPKGKPVLLAITGDNLPVGMNETAKVTPVVSPYAPLPTAGNAFHDGSATAQLGHDDSVFDKYGKVVRSFPSSKDGVVAATLYELHRGANRSLAEILDDNTAGKTTLGSNAAVEKRVDGKPMNDDAANAPIIGHLPQQKDKSAIQGDVAAIRAYFHAAGIHHASTDKKMGPMWCGSFATFVYARAGINIGSLAYSMDVPKQLAKSGTPENPGVYFSISGDEQRDNNHKPIYRGKIRSGVHDATVSTEGKQKYESMTNPSSSLDFDVRPGDVLWLEHDANHGHVAVVIGVYKTEDEITIITAEGNVGQRLQQRSHRLSMDKSGHITTTFKGWGRPAELNQEPAPVQPETIPVWIRAAAAGGSDAQDDR